MVERETTVPSYTDGYTSIYASDPPVFITADSILDAMHRSYDAGSPRRRSMGQGVVAGRAATLVSRGP